MPAHICASLISLVQRDPSRPATFCDGRQATAQQFHNRVALLSRALSKTCNVCPGDEIAMAGLNTDAFFEAMLAVVDAGAVACPLNTRWSSTEMAAAIKLIRPKCVIVDSSAEPLTVAACARLAGTAPQIIMLSSQQTSGTRPANRNSNSSTAHDSTQISTEKLINSAADAAACPQVYKNAASAGPTQQSQVHLSQSAPERGPSPATAEAHPSLQLRQSGPDGTALICFTSGTTGRSKGAMLSHSALLHQSLCKLSAVGYTADDVYLHVAPLFHVGGISSALAVLAAGGVHVFMTRAHPSTALQLIAEHKVTAMIAVPAMMQDITAAAAGPQYSQQQQTSVLPQQQQQQQQLITLKRVLIGGGTMTAELQSDVAALFPNALLSTAYGMTEASSSITFITLHEQQQRQATAAAPAGVCVGWPAAGIAVQIDPAALEQQQQQHVVQYTSGSSNSSGSLANQQSCGGSSSSSGSGRSSREGSSSSPVIGEVCTLGPHIMSGYWDQPDVTKMTITHDGWLKTGDLGYLDEQGCLWLVGRAKDMIKSGGENVHAAEVESALTTHPAVAAAAAVGLPHQRLGELVAAAVVLRSGWSWVQGGSTANHHQQQQQQQEQQQQVLSAQDLQQHCRSVAGLSAYKLPRVLVALQSLPTNSCGKVVKAEVRTIIQQQQQDVVSGSEASMALRSRL